MAASNPLATYFGYVVVNPAEVPEDQRAILEMAVTNMDTTGMGPAAIYRMPDGRYTAMGSADCAGGDRWSGTGLIH